MPTRDSHAPNVRDVLDFWFDVPGDGEPKGERQSHPRPEWFRKDELFDAQIRDRFDATIAAALAGRLGSWAEDVRGALALVIVLDQFTRNVHRDTPGAFAGDAKALAISSRLVAQGDDRALAPMERWFLYLPFEHAEDAMMQDRSIALFTRLRDETGLADPLEWAEKHAAVIRRFGRYPHRNTILGRVSTPAELVYLETPGSSF